MVSSTLCPAVHILGSQNVYGRAEGIADHYCFYSFSIFFKEKKTIKKKKRKNGKKRKKRRKKIMISQSRPFYDLDYEPLGKDIKIYLTNFD